MPLLACQPAPARVRCAYYACLGVYQQHGQAVCHHDAARQAWLGGKAGIGLQGWRLGRVACLNQAAIEPHYASAVYLLQKHALHGACALQVCAVGGYLVGCVAHVVAQVHAVVGGL